MKSVKTVRSSPRFERKGDKTTWTPSGQFPDCPFGLLDRLCFSAVNVLAVNIRQRHGGLAVSIHHRHGGVLICTLIPDNIIGRFTRANI